MNGVLWGIWALSGAAYPWPAWVTGLWGVALLSNAREVHVRSPITEEDVEREMKRLHPHH